MVGAAGSNETPKVSIGVTAPLTYNANTGTLRANNFQIGIGSLSSDGEQISIVGNLNFSNSIDRAITVNGTQAGTVGKSLDIIAGGTTGGITNTNGGNLNLLSGSTTGTGISNINFSIPVIGPSGVTTINSRVNRMVVNNSGATITGNLILGTEAGKATLQYTTNQARTYTIPDAGTTANFVMTEGTQTINGVKTFGSQPVVPSLLLGSEAAKATIRYITNTARTFTIPATVDSNFIMSIAPTAAAQLITQTANGGNGLEVTGGSSGNAYAIYARGASASRSIAIIANGQSGGSDSWGLAVTRGSTTNNSEDNGLNSDHIRFRGTRNNIQLLGDGVTPNPSAARYIGIEPASLAATRTYTLPDAGTNANFVMTEGAQTIAGTKTFSTALNVTGTTKAAGNFYAGTTLPTNVTRLNYDGYLYATRFIGSIFNSATSAEYLTSATLLGTIAATATNAKNDTGATATITNSSSYLYILLRYFAGNEDSNGWILIPESVWDNSTNDTHTIIVTKDNFQGGLQIAICAVRRTSDTGIRAFFSYSTDSTDILQIYGVR